MSGGQIGTVVGGAIGAYLGAGNPAAIQLGMAIGGTIGGIIDPVKGPKVGDGQQQSSTDGIPIGWVMGTANIAGTIVQVSKVRQQSHGGKGGPKTYTAQQDFAILVCESCSLRNSTIQSILMVQQDGKVVYDVRPGSAILGQSAKWARNVNFLFGDEAQLPHPTLEAITGIGNTPSYRGSCLAVFGNFNITAVGGRIPSFIFTVASAAPTTVAYAFNQGDNFSYFLASPSGESSTEDYSAIDFDDSSWQVGPGPFGNFRQTTTVPGFNSLVTSIWIRKHFPMPTLYKPVILAYPNDWCAVWLNGKLLYKDPVGALGNSTDPRVIPIPYEALLADNVIAVKVVDDHAGGGIGAAIQGSTTAPGTLTLADVITRICIRGGILSTDIDVADLTGIAVAGYSIARQGTAIDSLGPLLAAYFCYASEYDGQIHFKLYGANAIITVDDDDLLEANDANDNNVVSTTRNQETEFPQRIIASYMDPAQNYMPVTTFAERLAVDVKAIGKQTFGIPVVMPANQAKQAADIALKIAYATLEGTQSYSVPFAGVGGTYLTLCAGEPVIFRGKRWVLTEAILSNGYMKLSARYDRQSAYTSVVQAIPGNAPSVPLSPYSGPTTLIAMNLPSLRPQDTYGLYLAANATYPATQNWQGCQVQVSYDGQVTWANATTITLPSTFGTVVVNEPTGGEPLTVLVNGDLVTITDAQLAANGNGFAIKHASGDEVGQFLTATEDATIVDQYALTGTLRGLGGTAYAIALSGDPFVMLDAVYFLPINLDFTGKTIYLRGVGFGESAEDAQVISIVYTATQVIPVETFNRIDADGNFRIDSDGNQRVTN